MALAASMSVLNAKITERSSFNFARVDGDRINPVHIIQNIQKNSV